MASRTIPAGTPGVPGVRQQTWRYSVSFEFDVRPVLTHRGTVTASSYGNLVARAMKEAQKVLRPVNARSMVCVLLERVPAAGEVIEPELEGA